MCIVGIFFFFLSNTIPMYCTVQEHFWALGSCRCFLFLLHRPLFQLLEGHFSFFLFEKLLLLVQLLLITVCPVVT